MAVAVQAEVVPGGEQLADHPGLRRTCSPTRKKVAWTPWRASTSSTAGVPSGWGPSSKVR